MTSRLAIAIAAGLFAISVMPRPGFGQAMVEAAGSAAAASGSAGALKALSDTVKGALNDAGETVKSPDVHTVGKTTRRVRNATAAPPAAPKPVYEDPQKIQAGLGYDEMLRRFGPPALTWTSEWNSTMFTYLTKTGSIQLEFSSGQIIAVDKNEH